MQATCSSCNHWETQNPIVKQATQTENFGACNELSNSGMKFILPVVQSHAEANAQMITEADFGCNHYAPEASA